MDKNSLDFMHFKQKQIRELLESYSSNMAAPITLETRELLKESINVNTVENFKEVVKKILPHQLGILSVYYNIELYF